MKKKLIILLIIVVILGVLLVGCSSAKLQSPRDLLLSNGMFSWNAVEGAEGYLVYFNDNESDKFFLTTTSFDANNESILPSLISGQVNKMWVRAVTFDQYGQPDVLSDRSRLDFDYSRQLPTPKKFTVKADGSIGWSSVDGAQEYVAMVRGSDGNITEYKIEAKQGTTGMSGKIVGLPKGTYDLYIVARAPGYSDSEGTSTITYTQTEGEDGDVVTPEGWTVTFDMNYEGAEPITSVAENNRAVTRPTDPTREGFVFSGWYHDSYCLVEAEFTSKYSTFNITANTTIYAKWVEKVVKSYPVYIYNDEATSLSADLYKGETLFKENEALASLTNSDNWFTLKVDEDVTSIVVKNGENTVATVTFDKDKPFYKNGENYAEKPAEPVQYGVIVNVNGNFQYKLGKNNTPEDPNIISEYYGNITLNRGDKIVISDTDGFEFVNYEEGCGFTGTAVRGGEYIVYVKKYEDGDSIWVKLPDRAIFIKVNGSQYELIENPAPEYSDSEYRYTLQLNKDDVIEIFDNDGTEYTNYESDCGFTGMATADGEHIFYVKLYEDGSNSIYVETPPNLSTENITVYFYNYLKWEEVHAYLWNDSTGKTIEYSKWPGNAIKEVEGHESWYSVEVNTFFENIIFDDGGGGDGHQTADLLVNSEKPYYNGYMWVDGFDTESKPAEVIAKIYYYNSQDWSDVYAYCWTGSTPKVSWPGEKMEKVDGHDGWYVIEIDTAKYSNIIFDRGLVDNPQKPNDQTYDINIPSGDTLYYKNGWVDSMK